MRGRGESGAESSVASAVEKGRRTAHQEKFSARRDVRGGAGRSFEAACGGEWVRSASERSKRLREGFRGAACLFTWITSSRKVDRAAAPRIGSGVGGVKKGGEPPAAPRRSSFEDPRRTIPTQNKKTPRAFKGTSRFPRPPTLRAIVASSLATDVGALLFRLYWPLELSSLPRGNFEGPKPRSGLIRTFGFVAASVPHTFPKAAPGGSSKYATKYVAKIDSDNVACLAFVVKRREGIFSIY